VLILRSQGLTGVRNAEVGLAKSASHWQDEDA
jgi:hypothetical protein